MRLVAFRNVQGHCGVLEDRCAHRGVPLSEGTVCEGKLQCPYHGWQYDTQGNVAMVPALPHVPESWKDKKVQGFAVKELQGFIWAWVGSEQPVGEPQPFPYLREKSWTSFVMQTRFKGTVESCLENFLDCPHATFVHKYWFRAPTQKPVRAVVETLPDGAKAEFFEEPREKSLVWWLLAPRSEGMQHVDRFIAPNTSRVDYAFPSGLHYVITSSCTPINQDETLVHTVITFRFKRIGFLVRLFFEPLSRWIIRQDVKMLAAQKANLDRLATQEASFQSTPADLLGPHIVAWRKALMNGGTPPSPGDKRDVTLYL
jgi:phenylpropionate dioxygenase-like ring-hydroxylating dioxygenase large terminal subunit